MAKKIFDTGSHPFQIYSTAISSLLTTSILLSSGNVLADSNGDSITKQTKTPSHLWLHLSIQAKSLGNSARSLTVMNSLNFGR